MSIIAIIIITLTSILVAHLLFRRREKKKLKMINYDELLAVKHSFIKFDKKGFYYCNICEGLIGGFCRGTSYSCTKCGMLMHRMCRYKSKQRCKYVVSCRESNYDQHQWIEGNLDLNTVCQICHTICGSLYNLTGLRCLQCQKTVHYECKKLVQPKCDFGPLSKLIIKPNLIKYQQEQRTRPKPPRKPSLDIQSPSEYEEGTDIDTLSNLDIKTNRIGAYIFQIPPDCTPLIVIVNKRSGGQLGQGLLSNFYKYLNPIQIIDLIEEGLGRLEMFQQENIKILACGGDGTISSVVNFLKDCNVEAWKVKNPSVAILPLGTGNDLSRSLGWGPSFSDSDTLKILQNVNSDSKNILLDRWKVTITQSLKTPLQQNFLMYNYMSIGIDAQVCLRFHQLREKYPQLFKSAIGNKFIYTKIGADDIFSGVRNNFQKTAKLICDGRIVELPDVENIIFLNINSWAGGAKDLWFSEEHLSANKELGFKPQSVSDGYLEVIGIASALHLGRCQIGLESPIRICQGKVLELTVNEGKKKHAYQIDGEPKELKIPIKIKIEHQDKAYMLAKGSQSQRLNWESKILDAMDWAVQSKNISDEQKSILLNKIFE